MWLDGGQIFLFYFRLLLFSKISTMSMCVFILMTQDSMYRHFFKHPDLL